MAPPSPPPPPKTTATYLPLRWESTGDQWWYASPIDCAAANGHYDLVRELLRIDGNHLIKLTSLRRIRRLETVWDDDEQFRGAAKRRAAVARKLYHHCESKRKKCNSLVAAGYGGWLIYTAAAGGDLGFVQELLERNPLLVFGEGEYGVTDVMYAAARGKSAEVFRAVVEFAAAPRNAAGHGGEGSGISGEYKWEVMNRAVHAACRGGNLGILRELLINCFCSDHDILAYRDAFGSTLLHSAAARGQLEIVKFLMESYKTITTSRDHHGNTSLHVAAFRGQLSTAEALISASPSLIHLTNNSGDTFLHKAVLGFQTLQFRRLDRHLDLLNHLVLRRRRLLAGIINAANNDRRTALHVAVAGNSHSDHLVRILASAEGIDLNASDSLGLTPLDLLRQGPRSASGDVLIRRLLSAGAIFSGDNHKARQAIASRIRMHANDGGGSSSPGSCFRISDTEIFLHAGLETATTVPAPTPTFAAVDFAGSGSILSPASPEEMSPYENVEESASNSYECYRRSSFNTAAAQIFKQVLNWPKLRDRKSKQKSMDFEAPTIDYPVQTNADKNSEWDPPPLAPLRKRFSKPTTTTTTTSNSNNKRSLAVRSNQSSPSLKKKKKVRESVWRSSRSSSFSKMSSVSSPPSSSSEKLKGACMVEDGSGGADVAGPSCSRKNGGGGGNSKRMKSQYYLCFGNAGTSVKSPVYRQSFKPPVSLVA